MFNGRVVYFASLGKTSSQNYSSLMVYYQYEVQAYDFSAIHSYTFKYCSISRLLSCVCKQHDTRGEVDGGRFTYSS
jgi:hypothetical protein